MTTQEIENQIKKTVFKHLNPSQYQAFLFGSRVKGSPRQWSDYDVGIHGKDAVPLETIGLINEDLENSSLPVMVDVVDFSQVPNTFKNIALRNIKPW